MRELTKDKGGQLSGKSHAAIVAMLKHDHIDYGRARMIFGRSPEMSEMLSALVLGYGRLEPEMRERLMRYLLGNLQVFLEEKEGVEEVSGQALAHALAEILRPSAAESVAGDTLGVDTIGGPAAKPKRRKGTDDKGHPNAKSWTLGKDLKAKANG